MRARVALCLACLVLLGACTGDSGGDVDPEASATLDDTAVPSLSPSLGGFSDDDDVLDVAITEPSTLDPMRIQDPGSVLIARQLFESLTAWDQSTEEVVPAAAESWEVAEGGRRFIFTLRQGMTFHDGTPVTSRDFAFAFDRIAARQNASQLAYTLDRVDGFIEVNQTGDARSLRGIKTPDDLTLVIELTEPFMEFPAVLTHPGLVPLPESAVQDEEGFLAAPIGNGPFQMAEPWAPGGPVLLRRFEGFVRTAPLEGIRFLPFPDAATSWLRFVDGEFDVAEVPVGQTDAAAEAFGERGFQPFLASYSFGLNVGSPYLRSRSLRRAISIAIDRSRIATRIYKSTMLEPRGIVPAGMPGFSENVCGDLCSYDPEQAATIVAGLPPAKRKVRIDFTFGEPHGQVARSIRDDLEAAGLDVQMKGYRFPKFIELLTDRDQDMYRLSWLAEYPTADVFLQGLFGSNSPDNHSGFSSRKVDRLLDQARRESSSGRRSQLYVQAEKEILDQVPIVPIGSFVTHWAAQSRVEGIVFDVMGGFDAVSVSLTGE